MFDTNLSRALGVLKIKNENFKRTLTMTELNSVASLTEKYFFWLKAFMTKYSESVYLTRITTIPLENPFVKITAIFFLSSLDSS